MIPLLRKRSPFTTTVGVLAVGLCLTLVLAACDPADPLDTARQQQAAGDLAGSLEPLRELIVERPEDGEVAYLYGRALVATGQPSLATWPLRRAMEDPEWLMPAAMQLAQVALATGNFNEAIDVMTRVLEEHPEDVTALLFRAQAQAHWKRSPEQALADAERVLELEPDLLEAYEPLILALLSLGRHDEASEALAEAGERLSALEGSARSLAWHCSTSAIFASEGGDLEETRELWRGCLEEYPSDPTVVMNAVQFYAANGEPGRAVEALRGAVAQAPTGREFRVALASWLRATGESAEGEALLREATQDEDPRRAATAWVDLARFRHGMSEHGAAADALARAVERLREVEDPNPRLLFEYADALVISNQHRRALEVAEEISVPAQRSLIRGRVAQEQGDAAGALEAFDEALRVWPDNAAARYHAAVAAESVGDFERALEEYRYSIRVDVAATDARTRVARMLIAENRPLLAYQLLFLEVGRAPLEPSGQLLSMYLMARVANPKQLQQSLLELATRDPARLPAALARGAEGAADRAGPVAGLSLLDGAPGIDYSHPIAAPALRVLVRFAHEADQPEPAGRLIEAGRAARPEASVFHELEGLHLELGGAEPARVRAAYARAVELDPANAGALAGLGRLAFEVDPARSLALFERAAAADPSDPEHGLAVARALRANGRPEEAARQLDALLEVYPFEAAAAAEVVSLDLERGAPTERTLERARRASRFGGGAEAFEQLGRVYARLDQPEEAERAAKRAQLLRERADPGAPGERADPGA